MNQNEDASLALSCRFEKKGPIRFISHLDLTRAFHRAFLRARLPLKHSEGFSPHPKFSFALPLSVGTESEAELAYFTLKNGSSLSLDRIRDALQEEMPKGIRILSVGEQNGKFSEIAFASYRILFPNGTLSPKAMRDPLPKGEILVEKRNKKGKIVPKDISVGIHSLLFSREAEGLLLQAVLACGAEAYLSPEILLLALEKTLPTLDQSGKRILRTGIYRQDLTSF